MKRRVLKLLLWLAGTGILVAAAWLMLMPGPVEKIQKREADGEGVEIISFTAGNKKQIRISARRQRNAEGNNRYFDDFEAELEPKSPKSETIHVYSRIAYLFNDDYNIEMKDNVRIESKSLLLTGPYLLLKEKNYLTGDREMDFRLNQVTGKAGKGLNYNMLTEIIKLFEVAGVMDWEGEPHHFKCQELTITRTSHRMHFKGDVVIEGAGRKLVCQRMAVDFDDQMKETRAVLAVENVQLFSYPLPGDEDKNRYAYKAGRMSGTYENGILRESELRQSVELKIFTPKGEVTGSSNVFFVRLDPAAGSIRQVEMPGKGDWSYRGKKRNFEVTGDRGRFDFDEHGELSRSESNGLVSFKLDAYSGEGDKLVYSPGRNRATVSGPGTWIRKKGQLFHGKSIEVNTARNALNSNQGVASSVTLRNRPPFSVEPLMIRAGTVDLEDRQGSIRYTGSVEVTQEGLKLRCRDLLIADKEISAEGNVLFSFRDKDREVLLKGEKIVVSGGKKPVIDVREKAKVIMGDNQILAGGLVLNWQPNNRGIGSISAEKEVRFTGVEYKTVSDRMIWDLEGEKMRFTGNVTVEKGKEFQSRGEEVEIDTKTQQLRILTRSLKRNN